MTLLHNIKLIHNTAAQHAPSALSACATKITIWRHLQATITACVKKQTPIVYFSKLFGSYKRTALKSNFFNAFKMR